MKHIIWDGDYNAVEEAALETWKANHDTEEFKNMDKQEIVHKLYNDGWIIDESQLWYDCEVDNLNKDVWNNIIVIADLGLWNGNFKGYKFLGTNINEIMTGFAGDHPVVYADDETREVMCTDPHHDGTNRYTYRVLTCSIDEADELCNAIYANKLTNKVLNKYSRSLYDDVAEIYGWE